MAAVRQSNFSAGELAPSLHGRTDLDRYAQAMKKLFNGFVSRQGSAVSRPGAQYLGVAATDADTVRLIPFEYSDTDTVQNYVLEFSASAIRIWKAGAEIAEAIGSVPYTTSDLSAIRYVQSGDVMILACAGHPPATLSRVDNTTWVFATVVSGTSLDAYDSDTTYAAGDMVNSGANYVSLQASNTGNALTDTAWWMEVVTLSRAIPTGLVYIDTGTLVAPDASHPSSPREYKWTLITKGEDGVSGESAPVTVIGANLSSPFAGANSGSSLEWLSDTTYNAQNAILYDGLYYESLADTNLGNTPSSSPTWWVKIGGAVQFGDPWASRQIYNKDTAVKYTDGDYYVSLQDENCNVEPLSSGSDLWWTNVGATLGNPDDTQDMLNLGVFPDRPLGFKIHNVTGINRSGPNFLAMRFYRGDAKIFGWVGDCSALGFTDDGAAPDYNQAPPQGTNPFEVHADDGTLTRTETPIAVGFFEDRLVFAGTPERPNFIFASATGDYWNFDQRLVAVDDEALIFGLASRKREIVRAAVGVDKLFLFTGSGVWAVAGSQGPLAPDAVDAHVAVPVGAEWPVPLVLASTILWVRDKGTGVRSMVFDFQNSGYKSSDLSETAEHFFRGYTIKDWAWQEDPWAVAWVVRSDGALLSLTYSPDDGVWGWGRHEILGPDGEVATVHSVCVITEGDEDAVYLAIDPPGDETEALILRFTTRLEVAGVKTPACLDSCIKNWTDVSGDDAPSLTVTPGDSTTVLTGLTRLNGTACTVEVDGVKVATGTPAGGSLTIDGVHSGKVAVGVAYDVDMQLLPLGVAREKQKVVTKVALEVQAVGTVNAGADFDHLTPKTVSASTDVAKIVIAGKWGTDGEAVIRVSDPIPFTLRAVTREVDSGQG